MAKETWFHKVKYWSLGIGVALGIGYMVHLTDQDNVKKYRTVFPSSEKTTQILKESGLENVCRDSNTKKTIFEWKGNEYHLTCTDKGPKLFNETEHKWYIRDRNGPR